MLRATRNFSVAEALGASGGYIPPELENNAQAVLEWLQAARDWLGLPILITSLYRSPEHNAGVPGAANDSQHMRALGADFVVVGLTNHDALARLLDGVEAGAIPTYHQLITYTTDHHVHVGLSGDGWPADEQDLVKTSRGYEPLTAQRLASLVSDPVEIGKQVVGQVVTVAAANPLPVLIVSFFLIAPALGLRWS